VFVGSFTFDGVQNQSQFDNWVRAQRQNLKDRETLAQANTWQTVATMPLSMLDVTLLLGPVAEAAGAASAARVGLTGIAGRALAGGIAGGLDIGAQQAGVSALNDAQTNQEAFINIGVGMTLGAGMGAVFRHATRENLEAFRLGLHPDNLDQPIPVNEHYVGQTPAEGSTFGADSIGAARASADNDSLIATSSNRAAKAVEWATTLGDYTPLQRLGSYDDPLTRDTMLRLMDTGGLLTNAMAEGKSTGLEAETLKTIYEQRMNNVREQVASIYRGANADLGQSDARTSVGNVVNTLTQGSKDVNAVSQQAFNEAVSLVQQGSNAGATNEAIKSSVINRLTSDGLTAAQAETVAPHVYKAESAYHNEYEAMKDEAVRIGLMDPDKLVAGRYGMPQRWMANGIDAKAEGLKAFFMEHLGDKPTDDWLRENRFIADPDSSVADGEEALPASWEDLKASQDATSVNSTLNLWAGEQQQFKNDYLQARLQDAQQAQVRAQDRAAEVLSNLKGAERDWRGMKYAELRAEARSIERNAVLRSVASAQLKASRASEAVQAALNKLGGDESALAHIQDHMVKGGYSLDEAGAAVQKARTTHAQAVDETGEAGQLIQALRGQRADLQEQINGSASDAHALKQALMGKDEATASPVRAGVSKQIKAKTAEIAEARRAVQEATSRRTAALDDLRAAQSQFDLLAREQSDLRRWHDAASKEVDTIIKNEGDALLAPGLTKELGDHLASAAELRDRLGEAKTARQAAYRVLKETGMESRAAAREADKAGAALRKAAFASRKGTAQVSPLVRYVDDLVNSLRGTDRAPRGILLDKSPTSGRLKERQFKFNFDEYQKLVKDGYLAGNSDDAFQGYMRDLGGQMAAYRGLDGRPIDGILREIQANYDTKIGFETDPKKATALARQKDSALADVQAAHDRILGKFDVKGRNALTWTADRLRQMGIIRYMGGFVFSAIGDLATAAFAVPGSALRALALRGSRDYQYILKMAHAGDTDAEELKMILGSLETGLHLNQSDRSLGRGETSDVLGFGTGAVRATSRIAEKAMDTMADYTSKLSGLKAFSDNLRRTAGLVQLGNIRKWVADYDGIGKAKQVQLGALGIGEAEARRLNELFQKYGTEQRRGLFSPGMSRWLNERDGEHMKYTLEAALIKAQKRASYTSGYGNQPLLMNNEYGNPMMNPTAIIRTPSLYISAPFSN
jgi:hypothetical protein